MKSKQRDDLLKIVKTRFEKNMHRHKGIEWAKVQARLKLLPGKLRLQPVEGAE